MNNPIRKVRDLMNEIEVFLKEKSKFLELEHLSGPQGYVLYLLYEKMPQKYSFKMIEKALNMPKSTLSNLMKRMLKNEFIYLETDQQDKRVKYVCLTKLGLQQAKKLKPFHQLIEGVILKDIKKEELECVFDVIKKIQKNMSDYQKGGKL